MAGLVPAMTALDFVALNCGRRLGKARIVEVYCATVQLALAAKIVIYICRW
jgi:hypothetical protein